MNESELKTVVRGVALKNADFHAVDCEPDLSSFLPLTVDEIIVRITWWTYGAISGLVIAWFVVWATI